MENVGGTPTSVVGGSAPTAASFLGPFQGNPSAQPLGDNPFPPAHPAYKAFEEATWTAKESLNDLRSELLETLSKPPFDFIQAILTFRVREVSAYANAALLIVGNEQTAERYEHWIDDFARFVLDDTVKKGRLKLPDADPESQPLFTPELLPRITADLSLQLMRVVAYYKKEAANRVLQVMELRGPKSSDGEGTAAGKTLTSSAVQQSPQRSGQPPEGNTAMPDDLGALVDECTPALAEQDNGEAVAETAVAASDPDKAERTKLRSGWVDQKLSQHKTWTSDTDIAANGGPAYNTIQRFRSGARSTRDLYVRRQLANAFKCDITEVPA